MTINALSGVSGAGAKPSVKTHFVSVNESANAYGAPLHRHTPEIETALRRVGQVPEVTFVPHLIPITRGELETIVVDLEDVPGAEEVLGWYAEDYGGGLSWRRGRSTRTSRTWRTRIVAGCLRR